MKPLSVVFVISSLLLCSPNARAQAPAKVTVTITISKKTPSFSDQRLVVALTHNFPNQDDRGDKTVDRHIDAKFSHQQGKDTLVTITLGDQAKLSRGVNYFVNVSVFDTASKCTYIGKLGGESGPFPVLTNGGPSKLTVPLVAAR